MLELKNVRYAIGATTIVRDFSLRLGAGRVVALFGPSGCGKSTLLRLIAGILDADSGRIVAPKSAFVFQENALFFALTAAENVEVVADFAGGFGADCLSNSNLDEKSGENSASNSAPNSNLNGENSALNSNLNGENPAPNFALNPAKNPAKTPAPRPNSSRRERVCALLQSFGLTRADCDKYPHELSGGMRARVAFARALVYGAPLFLLDEPFSGLDFATRERLIAAFLAQISRGKSALIVTHDAYEAARVSDEVVFLDEREMRVIKRVELAVPPRQRDEAFVAGALREHFAGRIDIF